ncbi:MAG: NAD-dependent epimerase/dehydratase family protein, partial [Planctomycetes bacterium]|nr:NAD-dependent epimerase/dehydratase family protein [Planctomycetota bacterium]
LIIGPGRLGVLKRLFDCVKSGKRVPMIGDGGNRYQMVAVADVADACVCAIERRASGVFNLGSADPPCVRNLLGDLCRRAGSGGRPMPTPAWAVTAALWGLHSVRLSPLVPEQFRIAPVDYVLDIAAAREELGWTPKFGDMEMLWQAYQTYCGAAYSGTLPAEREAFDAASGDSSSFDAG